MRQMVLLEQTDLDHLRTGGTMLVQVGTATVEVGLCASTVFNVPARSPQPLSAITGAANGVIAPFQRKGTSGRKYKPEGYTCDYCDRTFATPQQKAGHHRYGHTDHVGKRSRRRKT